MSKSRKSSKSRGLARGLTSGVVKGVKKVGEVGSVAEDSVGKVYDTMTKGAKEARKAMPFRARSRARALAGGRRTRRRRTRKSRR